MPNALRSPLAAFAASETETQLRLHGSAVAFADSAGHVGALFLGPSGAGKSSLALAMMALGAGLVCDDAVLITAAGPALALLRPPGAPEFIEARGIGLLHADGIVPSARLSLVVDLAQAEPERLPPNRCVTWSGVDVPLVLGKDRPNLPAAVAQMLRCGRVAI